MEGTHFYYVVIEEKEDDYRYLRVDRFTFRDALQSPTVGLICDQVVESVSCERNQERCNVSIKRIYKSFPNELSLEGRPERAIINQLGGVRDFLLDKAVPCFRDDTLATEGLVKGQECILVVFGMGRKRIRSAVSESAGNIYDRLKRTKMAREAPSDTAKVSVYESVQKDGSERFLYDRPHPDLDIAPISLLYDGFGDFLDIMDGRTDVSGLEDILDIDLRREVDKLATKMAQYYDTDDKRRDAALGSFLKIFSARRRTNISPLRAVLIGSVSTDGHNETEFDSGVTIAGFKNWVTGISAIPQIQVECYYAHINAKEDHEGYRRRIYLASRAPCLGITVVGCDITFYALIAIDHRIRIVSLTPTLSCIQSASEGRDRIALYRAFTAASVLQARILHDTDTLMNLAPSPEPLPTAVRRLPALTALPVYHPIESGASQPEACITFQIDTLFPEKWAHRLLYSAKAGDARILVKFTRRYSIELHKICFDAGHAPRILGYKRLPGGWHAVAMEYIEPALSITHPSHILEHKTLWKTQLRELMASFHKQDFVHGDLRDANIICKDGVVMLIDFDWGGLQGEAVYPTPDLHPELCEGRRTGSLLIRKDDDVRVLDITLAKLNL